jgi:hypothetical protein
MKKTLTTAALAAVLVTAACSTGPSDAEKAHDRKVAAAKKTKKVNKVLGNDLVAAAKALVASANPKDQMNPTTAVQALKAKGYSAGASPTYSKLRKDQEFCLWATSPVSKASYVYQSKLGTARPSPKPVTGCVEMVYPAPAEVAKPKVPKGARGKEIALQYDSEDRIIRTDLQFLAASIERGWTDAELSPDQLKTGTAAEKKASKVKAKFIDKKMNSYKSPTKTHAGLTYGGSFGKTSFCVWMTNKDEAFRQAWVYQHVDKRVVRVKQGNHACTAGTVDYRR